jgi:hypothetical protein
MTPWVTKECNSILVTTRRGRSSPIALASAVQLCILQGGEHRINQQWYLVQSPEMPYGRWLCLAARLFGQGAYTHNEKANQPTTLLGLARKSQAVLATVVTCWVSGRERCFCTAFFVESTSTLRNMMHHILSQYNPWTHGWLNLGPKRGCSDVCICLRRHGVQGTPHEVRPVIRLKLTDKICTTVLTMEDATAFRTSWGETQLASGDRNYIIPAT